MPTEKQIQKAKAVLRDAGYIDVYWQKDDIEERNRENHENDNGDLPDDYVPLTEEQLDEARRLLEDSHDANYGLNWDSIDCAISEVV